MVRKGWCLCEMSVLGPEVGRGGNALAYDNGEAGMEKAWTASQRPLTHLEMCLMFPVSQGTKFWYLSLWLQCPQSHSCIHTRARTPMAQRRAAATFTRVQMCPVGTLGGRGGGCRVADVRNFKLRGLGQKGNLQKVSILESENGFDGG